jgi:hypothetical protein
MTTIAYSEKLGTISYDTLCVEYGLKTFDGNHIYLGENFIVASTGSSQELDAVGMAIESALDAELDAIEKGKREELCALNVINKRVNFKKMGIIEKYILFMHDCIYEKHFGLKFNELCFLIDTRGAVWINPKTKALGSGANFAASFMALKPEASTKEAVEFASQFDVYTGGEVKTFDLRKWGYI